MNTPIHKDTKSKIVNYLLLLIFIFLIFFQKTISAREIYFDDNDIFDELFENQISEVFQSVDENNRARNIKDLQSAKLSLINGDTEKANGYLNRINENQSPLGAIKKRYMAIITFINNDYESTLKHLAQLKKMKGGDTKGLCLLSLIANMAQNNIANLKAEEKDCLLKEENHSPTELFWFNSMLNLFKKNKGALDRDLKYNAEKILTNDEIAKLWLKINLYLNREKDTLDIISKLPESSYGSYKVRELIAFMYMREKNYERALSFVDDVDSVNAENIKGNIRVIDKAYELAFGHFKLALQKKADSINALEKGIPLSWLLGQWKDGIDMLNNISSKQIADQRTKSALHAAFNIRLGNFNEAKKQLTIIRNEFQNRPPSEILIMETFLSLKEANKKDIENTSENSCKSFDGMACYIASQTINLNNLGLVIKEDQYLLKDNDFDIESLKTIPPNTNIKEDVFVDQRDIEELDSNDAFKNGLGSI